MEPIRGTVSYPLSPRELLPPIGAAVVLIGAGVLCVVLKVPQAVLLAFTSLVLMLIAGMLLFIAKRLSEISSALLDAINTIDTAPPSQDDGGKT